MQVTLVDDWRRITGLKYFSGSMLWVWVGPSGVRAQAPLQLPHEATPEAWLLYLGMVTAALALLAFSWGAARLSPTALTVATLAEPLTAVLLAAAFLGEHLQPAQWLGALLLMGGIWGLGKDMSHGGSA